MNANATFPGYSGPERRRRVAYVTKNTEYHLEGEICIAVRDRSSGHWQLAHPTLRQRLHGSIRIPRGGTPPAVETPRVGASLLFGVEGSEVVTSHVLAVERPEKTTVRSYPV